MLSPLSTCSYQTAFVSGSSCATQPSVDGRLLPALAHSISRSARLLVCSEEVEAQSFEVRSTAYQIFWLKKWDVLLWVNA